MTSQRIIVGVDGSSGARTALNWAVDECRQRGCTLAILHADAGRELAVGGSTDSAEQLLSEYATAASARRPTVPVTTMLSRERAADTLIDLSVDAQLVVVGTRGSNGFTTSMLGSVSHRTAAHARCAVAVIPQGPTPPAAERGTRDVVAGATDDHAGRLALEFARHEAHARGTALRIVRADDEPVETLLRAAENADLLVLGCHHSDDRWATRLGPVPTAVLPRSPCPVVVVGAVPGTSAHAGARALLASR